MKRLNFAAFLFAALAVGAAAGWFAAGVDPVGILWGQTLFAAMKIFSG
jgi:hypothetical protein